MSVSIRNAGDSILKMLCVRYVELERIGQVVAYRVAEI